MGKGIPASQRTRESLRELIEGELGSGADRSNLVRLAAPLVLEVALEGEVSDTLGRAPGLIKAIESCFPRSARQRCRTHRVRNLAAKVPEDISPEVKERTRACCQAPSRALAREGAAGVVADYERDYPSATTCFMEDFEACIAHLRLPIRHRRATRTTNLLERLFVEDRRRLKIVPNAFGERPVLKLMYGAMIRAAERWRGVRIADSDLRQMKAVQEELNEECEATLQTSSSTHVDAPRQRNPSKTLP